MVAPRSHRSAIRAAYASFAVFGAFWGAWGASIPALRDQAGLSDGELGTALLFVGAGALPAMLPAGKAVDRWGPRFAAASLVTLGASGVVVALTAGDFVSLAIGLMLLGAASGACDVAINAAAGSAERASARPVITRAHGVFSAAVVVASLGTGLLRGAEAAFALPFVIVAVAAAAASVSVAIVSRVPGATNASGTPRVDRRRLRPAHVWPLVVVGGLGALAFAVENAHQSWSAVYLGDELTAGPALAAAGPAVFASVVAVTRFAVGSTKTSHAVAVVVVGAAAAAAGTMVLALATTVALALVGLGVAAAGTAVLYPSLLGLATARVDETARGAATAVVTAAAYTGFLAGPAYVGLLAGATDLPTAMGGVAALGGALALLAWPVLGAALRHLGSPEERRRGRGRAARLHRSRRR